MRLLDESYRQSLAVFVRAMAPNYSWPSQEKIFLDLYGEMLG
jgi:hypothetical protein